MPSKLEIFEGAIDKGLEGVVACTTGISSIVDSTLLYRGYTIEDLAAHCGFEEVVYLLWNDRLPSPSELSEFQAKLGEWTSLPLDLIDGLKRLPRSGVHPMAWLRTAVSMLGLWDADANNPSEEARHKKAMKITARMAPLVAIYQRLCEGKEPVAPRSHESVAWNFLYMLKGETPDQELVQMFDTCLVLHADHELNCSAFSARVTASSLSDMYSAITSAVGTLKGPLHGGANEQVMRMLKDIGNEQNVEPWLEKSFATKSKIMGFGHRVYKNGDPRAKILQQMSEKLCTRAGEPQWYRMSKKINDIVEGKKGLLPNVDFYSATVYNAMEIPIELFTPIFAIARVSGWLAHIFEQYTNNRIYRPRGKWVGQMGRKVSKGDR